MNRQEGYADVLTWAESASNGGCQDIAFIVEPTSFYHEQLVQFLVDSGATVYLVNPGRVGKFAEGIDILSKNDLVVADLLTRYGLMAKNLIPFVPLTKEVSALKSPLGGLTTLEQNLRREQNREEKTRKTVVLHKREEQSISRFIKQHEEEIRRLEKGIRETIKKSGVLQTDFDLLKSIPSIGEKTA